MALFQTTGVIFSFFLFFLFSVGALWERAGVVLSGSQSLRMNRTVVKIEIY